MSANQLKNNSVSPAKTNGFETNNVPQSKRRASKIISQPVMTKGKSADLRRHCDELISESDSDVEGPPMVNIDKVLNSDRMRHGPQPRKSGSLRLRPLVRNDFTQGTKVGDGAYGTVFKVQFQDSDLEQKVNTRIK